MQIAELVCVILYLMKMPKAPQEAVKISIRRYSTVLTSWEFVSFAWFVPYFRADVSFRKSIGSLFGSTMMVNLDVLAVSMRKHFGAADDEA